MKWVSLTILLSLIFLWTCQNELSFNSNNNTEPQNTLTKSDSVQTIATKVKYQNIQRIIIINHTAGTGNLIPHQQTTLHLKSTGTIQNLSIQEGRYIQKGQLIAAIEDKTLQLVLEQKQLELQDAIVNKKDLLIANGGQAEVDTSVSAKKLDLILTLSGYRRAQQGIKQAQFQLDQAKVYAPFSGIIADIKVKQFQQGNVGQEICRLLNPNTFEAEFQLTEAEALRIKLGQSVTVIPMAMPEKKFKATISTINPVVNEQGLVTLHARIKNIGQTRLLEGMNVKVEIERSISNQLVIPKSALVLRSGKEVVFTFDEKEKVAKWNYVTVAHENETGGLGCMANSCPKGTTDKPQY